MPYCLPMPVFMRLSVASLEGVLLLLVALTALWKGGKALDATWALACAGVLLSLFSWWADRGSSVGDRRQVPVALWVILLGFLALSIASFLVSTTSNYGLDELLRDGALAMVFLFVARRSEDAFVRRFATMITVALLLACVVGAVVYVLQPVNRFVGTFLDWRFHTDYWPNAWAEFVLLTWPLLLWMVPSRRRWIAPVLLGFVLGCLLLSYSRGAFLVLLGQLCLWGLLFVVSHWRRAGQMPRKGIGRVLFRCLLTAFIGAVFFVAMNGVRGRFHEVESVARKATFTASEGSSSISERGEFWRQSLALSLQRPLLGWGPYSFRFVQPRLQTRVYATSDHPHNVILKLAMERGWPATVLFTLFIGWVMLSGLLRALRTGAMSDAALVTAAAGVLAHNLIDYNLQFVGIALPLWIVLGLLAPTASSHGSNRAMRIVEVFLTVVLGIVMVLEGRMLAFSSLGRHAEAAGNAQEALLWYERARSERFSRDLHLSRTMLHWNRGEVSAAAAALDEAFAQNREDARAWLLKGGLFDDPDAYAQAYRLGRYNYLDAALGVLRFIPPGSPEAAARREEFTQLFHAYAEALLKNVHFIDLSSVPEQFSQMSALLQALYPQSRDAFAELAETVRLHVAEERERLAARSPGMLW